MYTLRYVDLRKKLGATNSSFHNVQHFNSGINPLTDVPWWGTLSFFIIRRTMRIFSNTTIRSTPYVFPLEIHLAGSINTHKILTLRSRTTFTFTNTTAAAAITPTNFTLAFTASLSLTTTTTTTTTSTGTASTHAATVLLLSPH